MIKGLLKKGERCPVCRLVPLDPDLHLAIHGSEHQTATQLKLLQRMKEEGTC